MVWNPPALVFLNTFGEYVKIKKGPKLLRIGLFSSFYLENNQTKSEKSYIFQKFGHAELIFFTFQFRFYPSPQPLEKN